MNSGDTLAILVGGGPAPGINGVIASATIEAINNGLRVIGLYDGYRHIARGDTSHVEELTLRAGLADPLHRRLDPAHVAHQPRQGRRDAAALRPLA